RSACFHRVIFIVLFILFFFHATPTTEIYTLSLHDALPISLLRPGDAPFRVLDPPLRFREGAGARVLDVLFAGIGVEQREVLAALDRKSTRLNSSHLVISYAVFCLKKKKTKNEASMNQYCVY